MSKRSRRPCANLSGGHIYRIPLSESVEAKREFITKGVGPGKVVEMAMELTVSARSKRQKLLKRGYV